MNDNDDDAQRSIATKSIKIYRFQFKQTNKQKLSSKLLHLYFYIYQRKKHTQTHYLFEKNNNPTNFKKERNIGTLRYFLFCQKKMLIS